MGLKLQSNRVARSGDFCQAVFVRLSSDRELVARAKNSDPAGPFYRNICSAKLRSLSHAPCFSGPSGGSCTSAFWYFLLFHRSPIDSVAKRIWNASPARLSTLLDATAHRVPLPNLRHDHRVRPRRPRSVRRGVSRSTCRTGSCFWPFRHEPRLPARAGYGELPQSPCQTRPGCSAGVGGRTFRMDLQVHDISPIEKAFDAKSTNPGLLPSLFWRGTIPPNAADDHKVVEITHTRKK